MRLRHHVRPGGPALSGAPLGAGCATCEHPRVQEINALINAKAMSSRKIAQMYALGKDSVSRHAWKRHPGVAGDPAAEATAEELAAQAAKGERERLVDIRDQLESEMQARPRSDISRELRQVNARIAELDGLDRPKTMTVADVAGLPEQVAAWFRALEPFPEARDALLAATDSTLLERAAPAEASPAEPAAPPERRRVAS